MRNLIKKTLKEAGHEVVGEAKNGLEGIELFEKFQPDIVTMDIKMPDISGIETTKRIMEKFPPRSFLGYRQQC
jgi:two-component system chemotaxis response regulator CheY